MIVMQSDADDVAEDRPPDEVVTQLENTINQFLDLRPLLRMLTKPALRERHWTRIFAVLGLEEVCT